MRHIVDPLGRDKFYQDEEGVHNRCFISQLILNAPVHDVESASSEPEKTKNKLSDLEGNTESFWKIQIEDMKALKKTHSGRAILGSDSNTTNNLCKEK